LESKESTGRTGGTRASFPSLFFEKKKERRCESDATCRPPPFLSPDLLLSFLPTSFPFSRIIFASLYLQARGAERGGASFISRKRKRNGSDSERERELLTEEKHQAQKSSLLRPAFPPCLSPYFLPLFFFSSSSSSSAPDLPRQENQDPLRAHQDLGNERQQRDPDDGGNVDAGERRDDLPRADQEGLGRLDDDGPGQSVAVDRRVPRQHDAHDEEEFSD